MRGLPWVLLDDSRGPQRTAFGTPGGALILRRSLFIDNDATFWAPWDKWKREGALAFIFAHEVLVYGARICSGSIRFIPTTLIF